MDSKLFPIENLSIMVPKSMGFIRLILACAVMFQHIGQPFSKNFLDAGFSVMLFFILSGFYITLTFDKKYKSLPVWKFYFSRYLRLLPLFLLGNFIVLLIALSVGGHPLIDNWSSLSNLQKILAIIPNTLLIGNDLLTHIGLVDSGMMISSKINAENSAYMLLLNHPTWSLSVELLFYLAAPFLVLSIKRVLIFMCIGISWYIWIQWGDPAFLSNHPKMFTYTPSYMPFFALGILSYHIYANTLNIRNNRFFYPICIIICSCLLAIDLRPESYPYIIFSLAIISLFPTTNRNKFDQWCAELSYPIYILHSPIIFLMNGKNLWSMFTTVVIASIISVYTIERPFTRFRSNFSR